MSTVVLASAGGPVGWVIGIGVATTVGLGIGFDWIYDNNEMLQDIGNTIDKKIDEAGKCLDALFTGVVEIFE